MWRRTAQRLPRGFMYKDKNWNHFAKNRHRSSPTWDKGILTKEDRGLSFTEQSMYGSSIPAKQLLVNESIQKIGKVHAQSATLAAQGVDFARAEALEHGLDRPRGKEEQALSQRMNEEDLGLQEFKRRRNGSNRHDKHSERALQNLMRASQQEVIRHEDHKERMMQDRAPTNKEFQKMYRETMVQDVSDEKVGTFQKDLVEKYGLYPSQRLDAYMLSDDSVFPSWVDRLPWNYRDRVKFGNMGLTEFDATTRVRLARMPMDERRAEWQRLKKAREYDEGKDHQLSPAELKNARQGKRDFLWMERRRKRQVAAIRRMALKKPEQFELWPTHQVDYSQRLALIAQHIEHGVPTNGQWPLDREELQRAKMRKRKEEEKESFMASLGGDKGVMKREKGTSLADALSQLEEEVEKPVKRLSRKGYARRVNNVAHGVEDIHGRKHSQTDRNMGWKKHNRVLSQRVQELERELRNEPDVSPGSKMSVRQTQKQSVSQNWAKAYNQKHKEYGIPKGAAREK